MQENIVLMIGGRKADLPDGFTVLFNYKAEELNNPTIVKNSYSKTVALPGTPINNQIFSHFYRSDRVVYYPLSQAAGAGFDPSKRMDFELYLNGDLQESGYLQLNDVIRRGNDVTYDCTLYGGLGDFFQSLMKKGDASPMRLADMWWKVGYPETQNPAREMDFIISKGIVQRAWGRIYNNAYDGMSLWDTINFIPMNEGIPDDDFDSDKVLIDVEGQNIFPASGTGEASAYTSYNGYVLGSLDKNYDWLATRDLRSYLQRPCFKVKRFFDTISDPYNNGGYEVELDPDFFNPKNPYFADTWITLPPLSTNENDEAQYSGEETIDAQVSSSSYDTSNSIVVTGDLNSDNNGVISLENYSFGYMETRTNFQLTAQTEYTGDKLQSTVAMTDYDRNNKSGTIQANLYFSLYLVQVLVYDSGSLTPDAGSNIYCFWSGLDDYPGIRSDAISPEEIIAQAGYEPAYNMPYSYVKGNFRYNPSLGYSVFEDADFNTWQLYTKVPKGMYNLRYKLRITKISAGYYYHRDAANIKLSDDGFRPWNDMLSNVGVKQQPATVVDVPDDIFYGNSRSGLDCNGTTTYVVPNTISSGAKITKDILLNTECTPADILLSYTKMFGLYWEKDPYEKKMYCRLRNNFYTGDIVDLETKIDYSKDFTITPVVVKTHYYAMGQETPQTYYEKLYKDSWGSTFGWKSINTNSNLNNDITELYDGNVLTNIITARDTSRYYCDYYTSGDTLAPAYCYNPVEVEYYLNGDYNTTTSITINNIIDFSKTKNWYPLIGYDFMERPVSYEWDGGEKKHVDSQYSLLFFNGFTECKNEDGETITFKLTDDVNDMLILNDGRCWLYTNRLNNEYATSIEELPVFSRYSKDGGTVPVLSLDFGTPRELYIDTLNLGANSDIYSQFWKAYLTDQFDANTRMVTCYVKLNKGMIHDCLRKFYYFDNALWVLNEVQDYDMGGNDTTKCVFIKVQDPTNYTAGQITYTPEGQ